MLFIWLINFLKGRNTWRSGRTFYAVCDDVKGLEPGSWVLINGLRVGSVQRIVFDARHNGDLVVQFRVDTDLGFSKNTVAKVVGSDLLGTKTIALHISRKGPAAQSGDTLKSKVEPGISNVFIDQISPLKKKLETLVATMGYTLLDVRKLTNPKNRDNIESILIALKKTLAGYSRIAARIDDQLGPRGELGQTLGHLATLTDELSKAPLDTTLWRLDCAAGKLNDILEKADDGRGSLGLLVNDERLYGNLADAVRQLELLLRDLRLNPERYVRFSIFGKKASSYIPPVERTDSMR